MRQAIICLFVLSLLSSGQLFSQNQTFNGNLTLNGNGNNYSNILRFHNVGKKWEIYPQSNNSIGLFNRTDATWIWRVTGNNLGVGTAYPNRAKLDVRGPYAGSSNVNTLSKVQLRVAGNGGHHTMMDIHVDDTNTGRTGNISFTRKGTIERWQLSPRNGDNDFTFFYNTGSQWKAPLTIKYGGSNTLKLDANAGNAFVEVRSSNGNTKTTSGVDLHAPSSRYKIESRYISGLGGTLTMGPVGSNGAPQSVVQIFNQKLWAKEICVASSAGTCPDYVFEDGYNRKSITELKNYIEENGHLPGVKSAKEIDSDGEVKMLEFTYSLLEKIEELTLYTIEQQEELDQLKSENEIIKDLALRLAKLEEK